MFKNSRRREAYFSDDGFAIGVAYILAILNQGEVTKTSSTHILIRLTFRILLIAIGFSSLV